MPRFAGTLVDAVAVVRQRALPAGGDRPMKRHGRILELLYEILGRPVPKKTID